MASKLASFRASTLFPKQPKAPRLTGSYAVSDQLKHELDEIIDSRTYQLMADYERSEGNYIATADGNILLDVFAQIASIAVGYNSPRLLELASSRTFQVAASNRPALGSFPPMQYKTWLDESLMTVKPKGLDQIVTTLCGSSANENAFKAAFMTFRARERAAAGGDSAFTPEEMETCMSNNVPGAPALSVLSFTSGFHGRLFGSLSATRSKAIHKLDIPAFDWPSAPFPELKYPLDQHTQENATEEARCLAAVDQIMSDWKAKSPVAAVIVEPILSEGGDKHASPQFFKDLIALTHRHGAFFICDEVQTGFGATGRFWAHEHWGLKDGDETPDFVTFSKKSQAAGFYHARETRPSVGYRNYNTWMGQPSVLLQCREIIRTINEHSLVEHTASMGKRLHPSLATIFEPSSLISNLRGVGTFIAFDFVTPQIRDDFVGRMKAEGVLIGGCGDKTVRLRPMLVFSNDEMEVLLVAMRKVLSEMDVAHSH